MYKVFLKTMAGDAPGIEVEASNETTVSELKAVAAEKTATDVATIRLLCCGQELQDGQTLGDYEVVKADVVIQIVPLVPQ